MDLKLTITTNTPTLEHNAETGTTYLKFVPGRKGSRTITCTGPQGACLIDIDDAFDVIGIEVVIPPDLRK
jgi:uncharacterized protein YuzE